ncbi:hypothetical protein I4U23_017461 [Adineta vaga]|nr:hypothetical protein I4U23_017461 [Adineta vaga]
MEFIPHPSYLEQLQDIESILSRITIENLNKHFERIHIQCLSFERLQTSGRINLIFSLKTRINSSVYQELILKISNPHRYWKNSRTKNEVFTMKYLLKHTTIPIPQIIDYSDDSLTNSLSCEYILMEKISGNTLETLIDNLSDEILTKIALELSDYVKQLRQIKLPNQIGSFYNEEMKLSGTIEDGPTLGPFQTIKEYIIKHLYWSIERIKTDNDLFQFAAHLIVSLEKVIDYIQIDTKLLNEKVQFHFTHNDLNSSNILIDEKNGQILGILDWERTAMTFNNNDIEFCSSWFENDQRKIKILSQEQNYVDLIDETFDMKDIQWYLDIMYSSMYTTFYSSTWFQNEQEVNQHMKHFLQDTENVILKFKNKFL